jgi:mono/diheme cytochrome c family protein
MSRITNAITQRLVTWYARVTPVPSHPIAPQSGGRWHASQLIAAAVLSVFTFATTLGLGHLSALAQAPLTTSPQPNAGAESPDVNLPSTPLTTPQADAQPVPSLPPVEPIAPLPPPRSAVIVPPEDPRLAKVFAVFQEHCAQCHQADRQKGTRISGSFGNILDLEAVAREPHLIRLGEPDASPLYQVLLDRHRPTDLTRLSNAPTWPTVDDIQTVRKWISESDKRAKACKPDQLITPSDIAKLLDAAALVAGETPTRETRVVSLAHFANACATPEEMKGYRDGATKLLNSLSWGARPITLLPIDERQTLLSFKLSDLGWVDEHWDALARSEPRATALDLTGKLQNPGAHPRPIRADWLANAASQPPFYAELLGLPPTLADTERLLGINRDAEFAANRVMRAGVTISTLTRGPRVIERLNVATRRIWLAYDFREAFNAERDPFARPLGAMRGIPDAYQFKPDAARLIFGLPNGFLAFAALDGDGRRVDPLPNRANFDAAGLHSGTGAGLACVSCHQSGLQPFTEGMRAHVSSDKFLAPREIKDRSLALYAPAADWVRILDEDSYRYRRALIQAGIDPDGTNHGLEDIAALARRYNLAVDLATAAAELGLTPSALDKVLATKDLSDTSYAPRLRQGLLSRTDVNKLYMELRQPSGLAVAPAEPVPTQATAGAALKVDVWTDQPSYRVGDLLTVHAQANGPCHLNLMSIDKVGKATVLFPNEFEPDNMIGGKVNAFPNDKSAYQFRLREKGYETIVAVCLGSSKLMAGIEPDYERQRFTILGNYENFLRTSISLDTTERKTPVARVEKPRPAPPRQSASRDAKLDNKPEVKTDPKLEQVGRASVRFKVE